MVSAEDQLIQSHSVWKACVHEYIFECSNPSFSSTEWWTHTTKCYFRPGNLHSEV